MAKYLYVLLCLAITFGTGYSLKCYHCNSEKMDGCAKGEKPAEQPCGNPTPNHSQFCYYKVAYDTVRKINFANSSCIDVPAGSQLDKSSVPDCKNPPANVEIKECRVCATDLCNSASVFSSSQKLVYTKGRSFVVSHGGQTHPTDAAEDVSV
ncbi:hypothetical protein RN001_013357 [Aquatica leii]|uniref:Sodefrin-like factor n=1 Tax=Aquatica leii TaxID=1421715 RepID=A0AAN7PRN8_9COLE|nr:hypothetical protein RN001_013357 [Aquatica leii]